MVRYNAHSTRIILISCGRRGDINMFIQRLKSSEMTRKQ